MEEFSSCAVLLLAFVLLQASPSTGAVLSTLNMLTQSPRMPQYASIGSRATVLACCGVSACKKVPGPTTGMPDDGLVCFCALACSYRDHDMKDD